MDEFVEVSLSSNQLFLGGMLPHNTITLSIAGCLTFGMEVTQFKTYVRRSECHAFMYMYIPCILHKMLWPVVSHLQVVTGTNSNLQLH